MATQSELKALELYGGLMEEVKLRIGAIDHCTLNRSGLAPHFVKDFCYLQLRMICELIAIGCLVAHGDIVEAAPKELTKHWSADRIMESLGALHPHFYPKPIRKTRTPSGWHVEPIEYPLSKTAFLDMYGKCGNALHRGNLRKLLKGQFPIHVNYPDITAKAQKILDLLANHMMITKAGATVILCVLHNPSDNNRAQVAIAEIPEGQAVAYGTAEFSKAWPLSE
jgi:hypothetical protein